MKYKEIKEALLSFELPKTLKLDACSTINDVDHLVKTHVEILDSNSGKRVYNPYYLRLKKIYELTAPLQPQF